MTYSHMGSPHTTIGDVLFHCWVRDGIRWVQHSMVVKQTGCALQGWRGTPNNAGAIVVRHSKDDVHGCTRVAKDKEVVSDREDIETVLNR